MGREEEREIREGGGSRRDGKHASQIEGEGRSSRLLK